MTKPYISGWCNEHHQKPNCQLCPGSFREGSICHHSCHGVRSQVDAELAKMAAELGIDLAELEKPRQEPASTVPSVPVAASLPSSVGNHTGTITEDRPSGTEPAKRPEFSPTRSGRKARGELEYRVYDVCMDWVTGEDYSEIVSITPKMISELIQKEYGGAAPSVGAIGACFDRWEKKGYAVQAKRPVRFIRFSEEVQLEGLEKVKERDKKIEAREKAAKRRGER